MDRARRQDSAGADARSGPHRSDLEFDPDGLVVDYPGMGQLPGQLAFLRHAGRLGRGKGRLPVVDTTHLLKYGRVHYLKGISVSVIEVEYHQHHRDVTGGWLRPAVFGVMDGLVSNGALIMGVAGGGGDTRTIVLTGLAGLVAGACSMATGEYTSVASQSELTRAEIAREERELAAHPAEEQAELAALYRARGLDPELADRVAEQLSRDPAQALQVHVREELGVDPDDLPSPWIAAGSSFAAFALGAFVPVLPFLIGFGSLAATLVVTAIALFAAGAAVANLTRVSVWFGGLRQLALAALAAGVTYGIGHLIGANLS
ncbi:MAG: hypothetical protein JWP76_2934 [Dactylosporangium sp.]|nr:hypothetical protein [Dactylosporangium sp.]